MGAVLKLMGLQVLFCLFSPVPYLAARITSVQNLLPLILPPQESLPETILERRTSLERGGIKSSEDFLGKVSHETEILPYARFGGDEFLVAGEDDGTVLFVGEVEEVVGIVGVEIIFVQGEHVVECGIEGEVVEEEVVEEVTEKEVGMLTAVGLVEGEVFGGKHSNVSRGYGH